MSSEPQVLQREQLIRADPESLFEFFANPRNLEAITPRWLHFGITTRGPIDMRRDARIEYRLRLAGFPVDWRTRIVAWEPGSHFIDAQEEGPFALWEHEHRFERLPGCVHMTDRVRYRLPLGAVGRLVGGLPVRSALNAIFDHRYSAIGKTFV
jgi:ligand-binding SRPBCC domain-containing protein